MRSSHLRAVIAPLVAINPLALHVLQVLAVATVTFACAQFPFFKGLRVNGFRQSLLLAALLALIYAGLNFFAAPLNWVTLGMFSVVVSAVAIELADFIVEGVDVRGWGWALLLAVIIALTNLAVEQLFQLGN